MTELERAAVHEAGHAVLAFRFGRYIRDITVARDGSGLIYCEYPRKVERQKLSAFAWQQRCAEQVLISIAGALAQRKYSGRADASPLDLDSARRWLGELQGDRRAVERQAIRICTDILDKPRAWRAVLTIAGHLIKRRRLSGAEVEAICKTSGFSQ